MSVDEPIRNRLKDRPLAMASAGILGLLLVSCHATAPVDPATDRFPEAQQEVARTLAELLATAERKDMARLESMHLYGPKFTRWDGKTPERQDAEMTRQAERSIEKHDAFHPKVEDLKVDVFGTAAVTTFVMAYEVVAAGQSTRARSRATLVWVKVDSGWKIVHEHFSPFPASP
jgi:ketosteroid isomerase-like protein